MFRFQELFYKKGGRKRFAVFPLIIIGVTRWASSSHLLETTSATRLEDVYHQFAECEVALIDDAQFVCFFALHFVSLSVSQFLLRVTGVRVVFFIANGFLVS